MSAPPADPPGPIPVVVRATDELMINRGTGSAGALGAGALLACVALSKQTLGLALLISLGAAIVASAERGARVKMLGWLALLPAPLPGWQNRGSRDPLS